MPADTTPEPSPHYQHDHGTCMSRVMDRVSEVADLRGRNFTDNRWAVLQQLLLTDHRALGAYEILERIAWKSRRPAPAQVYRALNFLEENKLVHHIACCKAYVACYHHHGEPPKLRRKRDRDLFEEESLMQPDLRLSVPARKVAPDQGDGVEGQGGVLLVCKACRLVKEVEGARLRTNLKPLAKQEDFQLETQLLEVVGICSACAPDSDDSRGTLRRRRL